MEETTETQILRREYTARAQALRIERERNLAHRDNCRVASARWDHFDHLAAKDLAEAERLERLATSQPFEGEFDYLLEGDE